MRMNSTKIFPKPARDGKNSKITKRMEAVVATVKNKMSFSTATKTKKNNLDKNINSRNGEHSNKAGHFLMSSERAKKNPCNGLNKKYSVLSI